MHAIRSVVTPSKSAPPTSAAPAPASPPAARRTFTGRLTWFLAAGLTAIPLGFSYLRLSGTYPVDSDGAVNALQAWDMLHGNLLLHGWIVSDVSFYTTELPQYMLIEFINGLSPHVVNLAAAMSYTLVVLLAAALAKGHATGRDGVLRVGITAGILLAPQLTAAFVLDSQPDHIGTAVPVLATWLLLDRMRQRWYVPVLIGLLLTWAQVADGLVLYLAAGPLAIVCGIRAYRELMPRCESPAGGESPADGESLSSQKLFSSRELRNRLPWARADLALAAAAMVSVAAAPVLVALIRADGGYGEVPLHMVVITAAELPQQLWMSIEDVLLLFGADIFGQPFGLSLMLTALHLIGLGLALWAVALGLRGFLAGRNLVNQLLVAGIVITFTVFFLGWRLRNTFTAHEIAPLLPMAAVLAGRLLATRLVASRTIPVMMLVLSGLVLSLGHDAVQPPVPAGSAALTRWLTAHHLRAGLAPYWQAASTTVDSGGAIPMGLVISDGRVILPWHWESTAAWYDPERHDATFVVTASVPKDPRWPTPGEAITTFGKPAHTYRFGEYVVQVWHKNLLERLHRW